MAGEKDRGEENKLFYLTGRALKFVSEIWQIHKERVNEDICV